jgi:hypothetical protein
MTSEEVYQQPKRAPSIVAENYTKPHNRMPMHNLLNEQPVMKVRPEPLQEVAASPVAFNPYQTPVQKHHHDSNFE